MKISAISNYENSYRVNRNNNLPQPSPAPVSTEDKAPQVNFGMGTVAKFMSMLTLVGLGWLASSCTKQCGCGCGCGDTNIIINASAGMTIYVDPCTGDTVQIDPTDPSVIPTDTTINDQYADIISNLFTPNGTDLNGVTKSIEINNEYRNEFTKIYFETVANPSNPSELQNRKISGSVMSYEYHDNPSTYEQIGTVNGNMDIVRFASPYTGSTPNKEGVVMPGRVLPIQQDLVAQNVVWIPSNNAGDHAMFVFNYRGKGNSANLKPIDPVDPKKLLANGFEVATEKAEPSDLEASGCNLYLQRSNVDDGTLYIYIKGTDGRFYRNTSEYILENRQ